MVGPCVKARRAYFVSAFAKEHRMSHALIDTQPVVVEVDSNLKRLYLAALQALAAATAGGAVAWHKKYEAVGSIINHTPPLYLAGGFSTDTAFYAAMLDETKASVTRNMKVARLATPTEIAKYSATNLNLAIAYVEAKNKAPIEGRGTVNFDSLKIQYKKGDKTVSRTLSNITRAVTHTHVTSRMGQL